MDSKRFETLHRFAPIVACAAMALFASSLGASPPKAWGKRRVIEVHTVEGLYAAIQASANCGTTANCPVQIHLAPGTYVLSARSQGGRFHPRSGSLRLPPGVSLVGSEQHVDTDGDGVLDPIDPENPDVFAVPGTETTIDGSQLDLPGEQRTDCAGEFRFFPDPVIYLGYNNTIASLTVLGGGNVPIGEPTNDRIDANGSLSIQITDTVVQNDGISMTFANSECGARHARSVLNLSHSVLRGGLLIQNFYTGDANDDPADGPEIRATVAFNLFYNSGRGLRAAAGDEGADGGSVTLHMVGNVFRGNGTNLELRGAVGRDGLRAVGNRLVVTSESDTFGEASRNVFVSVGVGVAVSNFVKAEFFDSRFIRDSPDTPPEFSIVGGEAEASDNHASVLITHATVETSDGVAVEGGLSIADETSSGELPNTARIEGSREEFLLENQGLPAPPEHFFLGQ